MNGQVVQRLFKGHSPGLDIIFLLILFFFLKFPNRPKTSFSTALFQCSLQCAGPDHMSEEQVHRGDSLACHSPAWRKNIAYGSSSYLSYSSDPSKTALVTLDIL